MGQFGKPILSLYWRCRNVCLLIETVGTGQELPYGILPIGIGVEQYMSFIYQKVCLLIWIMAK